MCIHKETSRMILFQVDNLSWLGRASNTVMINTFLRVEKFFISMELIAH